MIVANVGDSTALWGGIDAEGQTIYRELSAEHSPESVEEYNRVRNFRPQAGGPKEFPDMKFVYDASSSFSKNQCPPIFEHATDGTVKVTGNGRYYKNVRSEWATLVTTPPGARFQDALAFTRSLGDLHLHVYGVSCTPAVVEYDLCSLHTLLGNDNNPSVLLVCTDGVWDNWKYPDCINAVLSTELIATLTDNGQKATQKFLNNNLAKAKEHFGNQADNMTAVIGYISLAQS